MSVTDWIELNMPATTVNELRDIRLAVLARFLFLISLSGINLQLGALECYSQYSKTKISGVMSSSSPTTWWRSCYKKLIPEQIQFVTLHSFWSSLTVIVSTTRVQNVSNTETENKCWACQFEMLNKISEPHSGRLDLQGRYCCKYKKFLNWSVLVRCCCLCGRLRSFKKRSAYPLDSLPRQLAIENMLTKTALEMCVCPSKATVCIQLLLSRCSLLWFALTVKWA